MSFSGKKKKNTCLSFWLTTYLLGLVDMFCNRVNIPMDTNWAPLLANLFFYSYKADFKQWLLKKNDKRDHFYFPILNFPFICSNIPATPAYGVYIFHLIWYSRACGSYQDFLDRGLLLTRKLLNQGFLLIKLKSSFQKFYGRHHDLVTKYLCHKW